MLPIEVARTVRASPCVRPRGAPLNRIAWGPGIRSGSEAEERSAEGPGGTPGPIGSGARAPRSRGRGNVRWLTAIRRDAGGKTVGSRTRGGSGLNDVPHEYYYINT